MRWAGNDAPYHVYGSTFCIQACTVSPDTAALSVTVAASKARCTAVNAMSANYTNNAWLYAGSNSEVINKRWPVWPVCNTKHRQAEQMHKAIEAMPDVLPQSPFSHDATTRSFQKTYILLIADCLQPNQAQIYSPLWLAELEDEKVCCILLKPHGMA